MSGGAQCSSIPHVHHKEPTRRNVLPPLRLRFITFDFSIDVSFGMNQQFQSSASSGSGVRFAGPGGLIGVPPSKLAPDKHTEGEAYVSHNAIPLGQNFKTYSGYFDHSATPLLPV